MKVRVRDVQTQKSLDEEGRIAPGQLDLDAPDRPCLAETMSVRAHAEIEGEEVVAQVSGSAAIELTCARCLERFRAEFPLEFESRAPVTVDYIDISEEIRQQVLLALPPQPLCRPDCRGICPVCGQNRNSNNCSCAIEQKPSPFDALKNLKITP